MSPLISCIMPTADRHQFIDRSIRMFQEQTYSNKELIVLDDGEESAKDLVPDADNIRYFRTKKEPLGRKRNELCGLAHGEFIAHWDDDDFYSPNRLVDQIREIKDPRTGGDVIGLGELYFMEEEGNRFWRYFWPAAQGRWVHGGTLMYRKSYWENNRFPEVQYFEDLAFVYVAMAQEVMAFPYSAGIYAGCIHESNLFRKTMEGKRWKKLDNRPKALEWIDKYIK